MTTREDTDGVISILELKSAREDTDGVISIFELKNPK